MFAMSRKRRILIASFVAVAIVVFATRRSSDGSFAYLAQRPTACQFVRDLFAIVGKEREFDEQIYAANLNLVLEAAQKNGLESVLIPAPP
jgi:hypothetical protein